MASAKLKPNDGRSSAGEFFDGFAEQFDTIYEGKRSRLMQWVDRRFRRDMFVRFGLTFEYLGDLRGLRVLDIGCGSGPYLVEALKRGAAQVTGVDPAPRMLELAAQRLHAAGFAGRAELRQGYFPGVSLADRYDCAIVMGVMDYVADPVSFVAALRRCIGRGAVLSFPSTHWFRTPFRRVRYQLRRCPVWFYTEEKIRRLFGEQEIRELKLQKIEGAGMDFVVWMSP